MMLRRTFAQFFHVSVINLSRSIPIYAQEFFAMTPSQQSALKKFMQRLIREGVVGIWEWPRLQAKWYEDPCDFMCIHVNIISLKVYILEIFFK